MRPVRFLLAYTPEDDAFTSNIRKALIMPVRKGALQFIDQQMAPMPGAERDAIIQDALDAADVVLLVLSNDFLASDECFALLEQALLMRDAKKLVLVPLLARNCDWKGVDKLAGLQPLPRNAQFLDQQPLLDKAITEVAKELITLADRLRPALPPLPPPLS